MADCYFHRTVVWRFGNAFVYHQCDSSRKSKGFRASSTVDGANAYDNRSGLGRQWLPTNGAESFDTADVPQTGEADGLRAVRVAALYTPGTLIDKSVVLKPRMARPTLILNAADAGELSLDDGDQVSVAAYGRELKMVAAIVDEVQQGLALLRGVLFLPGLFDVQISKIEEREKEMVA